MAGNERADGAPRPEPDAAGVRLAVVCGRFNDAITLRLLAGARRAALRCGMTVDDLLVEWVPGAFEVPFAARQLARSGRVDAVVCLGAVIRGETSHYDFVAGECARGIQDVQLATGVPVAFGVLTTEDVAQARARSGDQGEHNVGEDCVLAALEMVALTRRWS